MENNFPSFLQILQEVNRGQSSQRTRGQNARSVAGVAVAVSVAAAVILAVTVAVAPAVLHSLAVSESQVQEQESTVQV